MELMVKQLDVPVGLCKDSLIWSQSKQNSENNVHLCSMLHCADIARYIKQGISQQYYKTKYDCQTLQDIS